MRNHLKYKILTKDCVPPISKPIIDLMNRALESAMIMMHPEEINVCLVMSCMPVISKIAELF